MSSPDKIIAETKHLRFVERDGWSYVERPTANGVVCIVACTDDNKLVLVEQYRPPVDRRVIELPAGLSGDLSEIAGEPLEAAARRELLEETGYEAGELRRCVDVASSAGLTNEVVTFFVAAKLQKVASGGGDESEDITVREIALNELDVWLTQAHESGKMIDAKVYGGLYLLPRCNKAGSVQ
ncbi:MAG: NUDIX hydrolase [Planctomycetes bacterium]|nr:NUDIX hydrolase [Planctomycetota bacterium]